MMTSVLQLGLETWLGLGLRSGTMFSIYELVEADADELGFTAYL